MFITMSPRVMMMLSLVTDCFRSASCKAWMVTTASLPPLVAACPAKLVSPMLLLWRPDVVSDYTLRPAREMSSSSNKHYTPLPSNVCDRCWIILEADQLLARLVVRLLLLYRGTGRVNQTKPKRVLCPLFRMMKGQRGCPTKACVRDSGRQAAAPSGRSAAGREAGCTHFPDVLRPGQLDISTATK